MKRLAILLCVCLALCSCGAEEPVPAGPEIIPDLNFQASPVELPEPSPETEDPEDEQPEPEEEPESDIYDPGPDLSPEETIRAYFERQYLGYLSLEDVDCDAIIDKSKQVNRRMLQWISVLNQRRRLLAESGMCYVDTEERPYEIVFEEEPNDDRMERWDEWMDLTGYTAVHFRIVGEEGEAYPPFMAVNAQHTMFLKEIRGVWKITQHHFPGSLRKFVRPDDIEEIDDDEMFERLAEEFEGDGMLEPSNAPEGVDLYDPYAAAEYAMLYAEEKNPDFYDIGDWTGNCANFVSQCVWAGFGEAHMDSQWRGGGSGTLAWENVNYFWNYITGGTGLRGEVFTGADQLQVGDVVQVRSLSDPEEGRYTHTMIVVDDENLILAQNTPACFVYYSDLANVQLRLVRPTHAVNKK